MNIGDIVALVKDAEKIPAIVTKVYENVHGEVVADLHELAATVTGVVSADDNPTEAVPEGGLTVTSDLTSPVKTAAETDAETAAAESAFSALSPQDQADFLAWQKDKSANATTPADGAPTA